MNAERYEQVERLFHEALQMYSQTLGANHQLFGIAHVRLGRVLLRDRRYAEAEAECRLGYEMLSRQATPPQNWLQWARSDLAEIYDQLHQPEKVAKFRAELAGETKPLETARRN